MTYRDLEVQLQRGVKSWIGNLGEVVGVGGNVWLKGVVQTSSREASARVFKSVC